MRNTYMEVLQMQKEAGVERFFQRFMERLALATRLKPADMSKARAILLSTPHLMAGAGKDLAVLGGRGALWLGRYATGSQLTKPVLGRVARRVGRAGANIASLDLLATLISPSWRDTQWEILKGWGHDAKQKTQDFIRDTVQGTDNGAPTQQIAGPNGSVLSLLNPISGITGGIDYVPKGYIDFWQRRLPDNKNTAGLIAHGTFKAGAVGLLAAGLVGGYRAAKHISDIGSIDKANRPGKGVAGQLSTTFEGNLSGEDEGQKKAASVKTAQDTAQPDPYKIMSPGNFTAQNLTATAIPLGVLLLSAGLAYKGVDNAFDKLRNKRLDAAIAEKDQAVKKLITARAQLAKGEANMEAANAATADLKDSDVYTKAASQDKEAIARQAVQLFGTATAAVILASAIGSYAYTAASDENNLKYKAYKKALKEYAKAKSGITPITVAPKDAPSYFAAIDSAGKKQAPTARELPSYDADSLNRPISISI